jgi:hypothetical protein
LCEYPWNRWVLNGGCIKLLVLVSFRNKVSYG